ncbi:surface polysaccharide O-acyltransferase-like enzyme [Melghirimyces profundicolus]|uniref:Surface polysaccharide O-acyltransferase-like enzyme n=1 Tax=Melghirimyces profundicolus TaxID=1242148 RepID=A0A2T6BC98_9BACL|nr:surface polysaccharide O-acyltransferase-like enzyme [Melghirimyces profundicolus]
MISGLILFYRYAGKNSISFGFYRKRLINIVVPYLLWSFIYLIYSQFTDPQNVPESLLGLLKNLMSGQAYYHLYFLFVMIQFYCLLPFLLWSFRKWGGWIVLSLSLWCTLGTQTLTWEETKNFFPVPLEEEMIRRSFFPWLFYFCVGGWLGLRFHRTLSHLQRLPLMGLLAVSTAAGVLLVYQMACLHREGFYTPETIIYALSILVLGLQLAQRCRFSLLEATGRRSLAIYLIHPLMLSLLTPLTKSWIPEETYPQFFFLFFVVLSISVGLTMVLERIPYGFLLKGR